MKLLTAGVLLACVFPAAASADPTVSVSASATAGGLAALPAKVDHRLTLTAGETAEKVTVNGPGALRVTGATVEHTAAVPLSVATCEGRWMRIHQAYGGATGHTEVTLSVAPFSTAYVDTTVSFTRPPWPEDTLAAGWDVTPASGRTRTYTSPAPTYRGPRGVVVDFTLSRRSELLYKVKGTVDPARTGRITLFGYAPGRKHAKAIATTRVRAGKWSIKSLRLPRGGKWEFYARYKSAGTTFADDASPCGLIVGVPVRS